MSGSIGRRRVMILGAGRGAGSGGTPAFGTRLIQPGAIAGGGIVTFSRAQVSSFATATDAAGNLVEYAADVPRYNGPARQLLLGGQRTNAIRNPRLEGAAAGTPGTAPTNMALLGLFQGTDRQIVGVGTEFGMSYLDLRIFGTANATNTNITQIHFETNTGISASPSQDWAFSFYARLISGVVVGSLRLGVTELEANGATVVANTQTVITISGSISRFTHLRTIAANTAFVRPSFRHNYNNGDVMDFVVRIYAPQAEQGVFASTPILPLVGSPAASTRGQDNLTSSFSTLFPSGVGTVLGSFMLPRSAPASADQVLFDINDGSTNNRIRVRNVAGGNTIVAGRVIGGVSVDATTLGSMTPGTAFRVGLTFDGTNIVGNLDGGSNQSVAGMPAGLTTQRIGNNSAGTAPMFGEPAYVDTLPYAVAPAGLPAAVAAIPS